MEDNGVGPGAVAVGDVGCGDDDEEGEEVGRGGEGLRVDGGVAHVFYDGGEEDGHAAESDVAT